MVGEGELKAISSTAHFRFWSVRTDGTRGRDFVKLTKEIIKILLFTLSALAIIVPAGCDFSKTKTTSGGSPESLTIGTYSGDLSALFWIAKDREFFSKQGANVQLKTHESGLESLVELLAGRVELATITEFVFASNISKHPELRILSVVGQTDTLKVVARKDHGIEQISDLKAKRIGLMRNTVADYCFHVLMTLRRIPYEDGQIMDLPPSEQVKAITKGDIDAAVVWEPFPRQMRTELGANAISWSAQSGQDFYWLLIGTDNTLKKRSSEIRRVLAALALAEDFVKDQRDEAKRIVASQVGSNHMPELWQTSRFELSLGRPFVVAMEAEIRWMNYKQQIQQFKMPDLLDFISFDALNSVRPDKIQMLH